MVNGMAIRMANPKNTYKIYPNPSKEIVNIVLQNPEEKSYNQTKAVGELFDMMGLAISKVEIIDNNATFSVQGLKQGIYVLKIIINDQIETHQIIVE